MQAIDYAKSVTESFALPDTCSRIREMLDDDYSNIDDIAEVIAVDPSLAASLIKLANSALYNFPNKVTTIGKAVNVIGGESVYSLVMTETASSVFKQFDDVSINLERFWQQSVFTSLIARELGKLAKCKHAEQLFLTGLVASFGELAVARQAPELAANCEDYHAKLVPWQVQKRVMGFTYADVSYHIMRLWGVPEEIYSPIRQSFNIQQALEIKEAAIINGAIRGALTLIHPEFYSLPTLINLEILKSHNISEEMMVDAVAFARQEAQSILFLMNPDLFLVF